VHNFKDYN